MAQYEGISNKTLEFLSWADWGGGGGGGSILSKSNLLLLVSSTLLALALSMIFALNWSPLTTFRNKPNSCQIGCPFFVA